MARGSKSGPGAEVLWPAARDRCSSKHCGFQRYFHGRKGTVDLRLNRYFVKLVNFRDNSVLAVIKTIKKKIEGRILQSLTQIRHWLYLPWVVSPLSNTQSLTHAAVGRGPI